MRLRKRSYREADSNKDLDVFFSFTDLMSNAFMIMSLLLLFVFFQLLAYQKNMGEKLDNTGKSLEQLQLQNEQLTTENNQFREIQKKYQDVIKKAEQLKQKNQKLQSENNQLKTITNKLGNAQPIIINEKSGKFKFESGKAELKAELINYINQEITPQIGKIIKEKNIDFVQVIGHTDGQVINSTGNLDQNLEKVAQNQLQVSNLKAGSNADLALMRALAVVQELSKQPELKNVNFRAYSAAQLYLPSGELAPLNRQQDEARRRIEIRFIPPGVREDK